MSEQKKKSKKQSVANSKLPLSTYPIYLDRSLGKHVIADALRSAGVEVEIHDDHLPVDAPDEDWISLVGGKKWIAITKDKNIRYRSAEIQAIRDHDAMVIVVRAKNTTGEDIGEILKKSLPRIQRFARKHTPPFVARIDRSGKITPYIISPIDSA